MKSNVTLKGTPVTLAGKFIATSEKAPDFTLVQDNLHDFTLKDAMGYNLILSIFPSLDTDVCATTVRHFNRMANHLPDTRVLCISKDLPFAQRRFCTIEGLANVTPLSDFRPTSHFGEEYGVLITDGPMAGLLARAVVVINAEGIITYSELVSEITNEPDYDAILKAVQVKR